MQTHPKQYGVPFAGVSLANLEIGGTNLRSVDFFCRAQKTATVTGISWYQKADGASGSYSKGTGGTIKVEAQSDNGAGKPSGSVLATKSLATGVTELVVTHTFVSPFDETAGQLYHYVFSNTDASPTLNYVSEDDFNTSTSNPRQPGALDRDLGVMMNDNGAGWNLNAGHTPLFDKIYADGSHDGLAFYDAKFSSGLRDIGGVNATRMVFVPRQDMYFNRLGTFCYRQAGTTLPLDLEVWKSGAKIAAGQATAASAVSAASGSASGGWVSGGCPVGVLLAGQTYSFENWSRSETTMWKQYPMQAGEAGNFGQLFLGDSRFAEGWWEYTTNSGGLWTKESSATSFKMGFYLELVDAPSVRGGRRGTVYA